MASSGHFITLMGLVFFFVMIFDSIYERRLAIPTHFGLPRWHKRISYYIFKIRFISKFFKKQAKFPRRKIRLFLSLIRFNEYEFYIFPEKKDDYYENWDDWKLKKKKKSSVM
jgi:hypothetical protein